MRSVKSVFAVAIAAVVCVFTMPMTASAGMEFVYNSPPNSNSIDAKVISFIKAATTKLDIAIYQISQSQIVDEIIAAKVRGVAVRMVTETDNWNASCDKLVASGITVVKDNAGGAGSGLMHNKFIIRDGNAVLTGTYNFTTTQTTNDKNSIIIVTSATGLANIFTTEFNKMFVSKKFGTQKTTTTADSTIVDGYTVRVYFSPKGNVNAKIVTAIGTANSNIWFNIFTFTDQGVADALKSRKAAGVIVKGSFDRWQADGTYSKDENLAAGGCEVHRDTMAGLLHDKIMAIDGGTTSNPIAIIGSHNFTSAANSTNDENMLVIYGSTPANSVKGSCISIFNTKSN